MTPLQSIRYVFQYSENNGPWTDYTNLSSDVAAGVEVSQSITLVANTKFRVYYTTNQSVGSSPNTVDPTEISITVNQLPAIALITASTTSVCQNSDITYSDAVTGGVWTSSNASIATVGAASGIVHGVSQGSALIKYIVTDPVTGCKNQDAKPVSVNPTPMISDYSATVCSGALYSALPAGFVPLGTTFNWDMPTSNALAIGDLTGMAASATTTQATVNAQLTNHTNNVIVATYSITATKGACVSIPFHMELSVTPKPFITDKVVPACSGTVFTDAGVTNINDIVPVNTFYSWSAPTAVNNISGLASGTNQTNLNGTLTNSTNATISVIYNVTTSNNGCPGSTFTATVNVKPTPNIANKAATICSNNNFNIVITNGSDLLPAGTTYTWAAPITSGINGAQAGTSISTISGTLSNSTNAPIDVNYFITPNASGCTGASFATTVTVNPVPVIANMGPTQVGSGSNFNFTLGGQSGDIIPAGITYAWLAPTVQAGINGGVASGTPSPTSLVGSLTNFTGGALNATYNITPSYMSCAGANFTYIVRVYPKPIIGNKTVNICSGMSFTVAPVDGTPITEVVPSGTTYSWAAPINAGITGTFSGTSANVISATLTNTTNAPITVIYIVTPFANPQSGDPFEISVTVNPLPIANIVITENSGLHSNDNIICSDVNASFAAVPVVGALTDYSYAWTVPGSFTNPGNVPSFDANISGTYGLRITNISTLCASAVQTTTSLVVNPIPTVGPIVGQDHVCVNSSITLSTTLVQGGSGVYSYYYWYDSDVLVAPPFSSSTVLVTGRTAGIGNITYKVQDNVGCYSAASTNFPLLINALPLAPTANSINQIYDGLLHTGGAIANDPANEQVNWYANNVGATTAVAPSATNVGATITKYASATNTTTGCVSATRTAVSVRITTKTLTITAVDSLKVYDRAVFLGGNGVTYDGFVNGENQLVLGGSNNYSGTSQNAFNVGNYTIIPGGRTSTNYAIVYVPGTLSITKRPLNIASAAVQDKVYDGTDVAIMNAGSLSGLILADAPNVTLNRIAKFSSKNVGANLVITSISTITGSAASNYQLNPAINATASITPKHIAAIGVTTTNKVYDGTIDATVTGGGFTTAIAAGTGTSTDLKPYLNDDIQLVLGGAFANKDVGNNIAVVANCTIVGTDKDNYILDQPNLQARNISPKPLNMQGLSIATPKIYDGTTLAFLTGAPQLLASEPIRTGTVADGKPYAIDVVNIAGVPVGTYNAKDVLTANSVSITGLSLSGTGAGNYSLTIQSPISSSILPKDLTMYGLTVPSTKIYDGNTISIVQGNANLQVAELYGSGASNDGKPYIGDDVYIIGTAAANYNSKNVVNANAVQFSGLSIAGNQASNYHFVIQTNAQASILPLLIHVIADPKEKTYGLVDPIFTYSYDSLIPGDIITGALGRVVGENIGRYAINLGTFNIGSNYVVDFTSNFLEIKSTIVTIQPDAVIRTYGDAPLSPTMSTSRFQILGLMNNEKIDAIMLSIPVGLGTGNDALDPAGTYANAVQGSTPTSSSTNLLNYQFRFLPADIIIKKYPIQIIAEPKQKRKLQIDPPFTYHLSRTLVNGDQATGSLTRGIGEEVGFYSILQGTVHINDNYDIQYVPDNLEILTIERVITLPNAFTPNNDGLNDVVKIMHNSTIVGINYFKVFNRTGMQIFETKDINQGWDGRVNGAIADPDAYYWILEYVTWDDKIFKMKGSFILLK
jgi:gliding motility-associated-like protein